MGTKVMIVDDALIMRMMLRDILKAAGCEIVAEVGIPALVLKKYDETSPDVVCLDLTLDDSLVPAGITLLDEIRKRNPRAKVIIISALEQKEITDQALKLGAKAYITKPFDKMEVAATIKRVAG